MLRAPTNSSRGLHRRVTDGHLHGSDVVLAARERVRRAAPSRRSLPAARSPRASRAAPTPTPSRHRRRDGRRCSRQRCGAKIAEPEGQQARRCRAPAGASASPIPSHRSTTTAAASRDPDPNARENPRDRRPKNASATNENNLTADLPPRSDRRTSKAGDARARW